MLYFQPLTRTIGIAATVFCCQLATGQPQTLGANNPLPLGPSLGKSLMSEIRYQSQTLERLSMQHSARKGAQSNPAFSDDLREVWRETLLAHRDYPLTYLRYPPQSEEDLEGDYAGFTQKSSELNQWLGRIYTEHYTENLDIETVLVDSLHDPDDPTFVEQLFEAAEAQKPAVGGTLSPAILLPQPLQLVGYEGNRVTLEQALQDLPQTPSGVVWNTDLNRFEYTNIHLKRQITTIVGLILRNPLRFRETLLSLPEELNRKIRQNSDSSNPTDRTEPFDLLIGLITAEFLEWRHRFSGEPEDWIGTARPMHRFLHTYFGMNAELDPIGAALPNISGSRSEDAERDLFTFRCAYNWQRITTPEDVPYGQRFLTRFFDVKSLSVAQMLESGETQVEATCGEKTYEVELEAQESEPMTLPPTYDLTELAANRPAEVLVSFSLVNEITKEMLRFLEAYLAINGYRSIAGMQVVPTRETFLENLASSDVLIPVAHLLDVNSFHVGTENSHKMVFQRRFRNPTTGTLQKSQVTVLFPKLTPNESSYTTVSRDEIARALQARRRSRPGSLFVLHTSCYGGKNLRAWTRAFREALVRDVEAGNLGSIAEANDVPLVFAFRGGFPTAGPLAIATSMLHPLNTIALLSRGVSGEDVYTALQEPAPEDLVYKALRVAARIWPELNMPENTSYDPVWNLHFPALLENDAYLFVVRDPTGEEPPLRY